MAEASKLTKFLFLISLSLCFVLTTVLLTMYFAGPSLRFVFAPYQFFLIGMCMGALAAATVGLIVERSEWPSYGIYFATVMVSVFLLMVLHSVIFRVLGGGQFMRSLMKVFSLDT